MQDGLELPRDPVFTLLAVAASQQNLGHSGLVALSERIVALSMPFLVAQRNCPNNTQPVLSNFDIESQRSGWNPIYEFGRSFDEVVHTISDAARVAQIEAAILEK
jgi:hypothetical protein